MPNNAQALSTTVLSLPEMALTRDGHQFFPEADVWRIVSLGQAVNFRFSDYRDKFSDGVVQSFKQVMIWYLQEHSMAHAKNLLHQFYKFFDSLPDQEAPITEITSPQLLSYRSQLLKSNEWCLGVISGLLKQWHSMGYPGIHDDVPRLFDEIKLKGNSKGNAVRTMDPEKGPFTDLELQAIHGALNDSFANGEVSVEEFVLVSLFTALGARNIQIAALKCKDLLVGRADDGSPNYILSVPSAKKRGAPMRTAFRARPLIREIGEALEAWINHVKKNNEVEATDTGNLPIFPQWFCASVPGFEHHSKANEIGVRIKEICLALGVVSERTGDPIKVTSRRFRYTLGTRAADEGLGELVIAELLDHSDTQSVGVYVESTPAIAARIDKATAMELAPIAQAFLGLIVDDETDAKRGDDLTSRIGEPSIGGVGTCGKYGFCGGMAPVACYTCRNFQPWLDAPHEQLLESLIADRDRLLGTTDDRIASTNDRTILAVADVISRCETMREERGTS